MRIRSFRNEKRNQFYFRVYNDNDNQILRSEAYNSKAARNNGIESFKTNAPLTERYERLTSADGKYYFNLKAANHQVVATSLMFETEAIRDSVIAEIIAYATSSTEKQLPPQNLAANTPPSTSTDSASGSSEKEAETESGKEQDDYMDQEFYEESGTGTKRGFDSFQKGDHQFYYFSFKSDDGNVLLISQGYTQESGRDNGIASVEKNSTIETRYSHHTTDDGKFFFILKAGNHQEIARSVHFDSKADMERAIAILMNGGGAMVQPEVVKAVGKIEKDTSKEDDDYMEVEFYTNSGTGIKSGFDKFQKGENNYYYFSFKSDDGNVLLISQGYTQESGRDNGITSIEKNSTIETRYSHHTTDDGKFFFILKAGNHQEIARSVHFDSKADMERAIAILMNGGGAMVQPEVVKAVGKIEKDTSKEDDDYMEVEFYTNSGTGIKSGFDKFQKGENNYYYFSFKSDDGNVLLISQGYTQESGRDNGITSIEKNSTIETRYSHHTTDDGKFFFILKAGNHQEIARSVHFDSKADMERAIAILMNGGGAMVQPEVVKAVGKIEKDTSKEDDDYMEVEFYANSGTGIKSGFDKFQKGENNYYYFSFKSDDGKVLLLSQGYTQEAGRDNGIASVSKNSKIEKRYFTHSLEEGKWFFTLKAGNHQEIARSVDFDSEDNMKIAMAMLMNSGSTLEAKATGVKATPKTSNIDLDDYRTFGFYKESGTGVENGWDRFYSEKHNEYYFCYNVDGEPTLISEGYTTEAARENGIASVEKNWGNEKRYKYHETPGGRYYYTLMAGNHQEIARSKWYSSADERDGGIHWLMAGGLGAIAASNIKSSLVSEGANESVETKSTTLEDDDYLPCKAYEGHDVHDKVNNVAFFRHKNGQFYFVIYKENGTVSFRSEGFPTTKERDVELSGALKSLGKPEMIETIQRGLYQIHILRDHTGREVGRSCLEKKVVATKVAPIIETATAAAIAAGAVGGTTGDAVEATTGGAVEATTGDAVEATTGDAVEATTGDAVEGTTSDAVGATTGGAEVVVDKEDDYLPCREYEGRDVNDKANNVAFFKHDNGLFYFVVYKEDGTVRLRSEGFKTAKERDVELSGMLKNIDKPEMYETITKGKYSIHILRDATGREVGRSCLETEEKKAAAVPVVETATAAAVAAAAVGGLSGAPKVEMDKEDDYLPCREYEGHDVNDKANKVAFFKHDNGQYYFAIYKDDGRVRLRSEGFRTTKERDVELSGALKNLNNPDRYESITRGKYSIHILKDNTGREVGRSCMETEDVAAAFPIAGAAAAAAAAAGAAIIMDKDPEIQVDEEVVAPVVTPVVAPVTTATAAKKAAAAAPVAAATAGGGGWGIWKWIIGALILLALLLLLMKACGGCDTGNKNGAIGDNGSTTPTTVGKEDTSTTLKVPPVDTSKVVVPPVETASCNCSDFVNVFNLPAGQTPKVLNRLGTEPEFGNSSSLDPTGFYNKLKTAAANNPRDKRFLDKLFKAMGYENGVAGVNAGMFSNATVPVGTIGYMGFGKKHRTLNARLNTSGKDLEAFRIKAANGCDMHFMKTCGNHFFFCSK